MRALAAALAAAATLLSPPPAAGDETTRRPDVSRAEAAILVDAGSGDVLLEHDARERRAIASATKLMTALLLLERARPDERFAAPAYRALPAESKIGLRRGERMAVDDLLEALLLESANDAAVTVAAGVSGSRGRFVRDMNARASELGLDDTRFANPIGLDDPANYSSARDLARLAVTLMRKPRFASVVDLPAARLESGERPRTVVNRNRLVRRVPVVDGIKTGFTGEADYVLVGSATGATGARVISVVLGEPSERARDADTLALLRYGLAQFRRVHVLRAGRPVARVAIKHRDDRAALVPSRGFTVTARRGERVEMRIGAPEELEGPLAAGERVGSVAVVRGGKVVRRVDLVTADAVPGAGTLRVIISVLGVPLTLLVLLGIVLAAMLAIMRVRGVRIRISRKRPERLGRS
jgi:serine-type D-Ala-D-Ala carboxypeptidase (penicillin-binding protein 5/6)